MSAATDANVHTTPVRNGYGFDEAALVRWMEMHVNGFVGPLIVEQFKGGQSNPTYKLITPNQSYVLRRKPPGQLLKSAHAVEREAKVQVGLEKARFPVAHVHALCTDDDVIGTSFYVMDMIDGRIFWIASVPGVSIADRRAIFDAMNATLAQLHMIRPADVGLSDYGRPGSYFERQLRRWSQQYLADVHAGRDPNMDRLIEWLPTHIPTGDETVIAHGDIRIDNLIFHPSEPSVLAVLDWELSTLGHAGADFAYHAMMYRMPPHIVAGLGGIDTDTLGIPSELEYLSAYCRRTARTSLRGMSSTSHSTSSVSPRFSTASSSDPRDCILRRGHGTREGVTRTCVNSVAASSTCGSMIDEVRSTRA